MVHTIGMLVSGTGWLVPEAGDPEVRCFVSARTVPLEPGLSGPLGVCWHWTASKGAPGSAEALARSIQVYRRGVDAPASWHLLIARDGRVYQSIPFTLGSWHVGKTAEVLGTSRAVNRTLVGIELENAGDLVRGHDGVAYRWPYYVVPGDASSGYHAGCAMPPERAIEAAWSADPALGAPPDGCTTAPGLFDSYTADQEHTAGLVARALAHAYGLTREALSFGHYRFDSPRKRDPGPLWMQRILPRVLDVAVPSVAPVHAELVTTTASLPTSEVA